MAIAATKSATQRKHVTVIDDLKAIWTLATLTVTEAMRRRFWLAALIVCGFYVLLAFFPFHFSAARRDLLGPMLNQLIGALMGTFGAEMIEFFCFLFAVALSAGAISAEIERGTLAVIVPKPIPRWTIYCGKWLGVNLFLAPLLIFLTCLLQWAIWMHIHQTESGLWRAMGVMYLYPLVFSSLTLLFSTFSGNLLATILPLIMASTTWSEGILKQLGWRLDVESLKLAAKYVVYVVPLNPMSRWLERAESFDALKAFPTGRGGPMPIDPPANYIDLAWILAYALGAFLIGLITFQKRDI